VQMLFLPGLPLQAMVFELLPSGAAARVDFN
jgi:hypothetical protein